MARITQEDFAPVYMNVRKYSDADEVYPKIVQWSLTSPLVYYDLQVMITILQRQMDPYDEWEYYAAIQAAEPTLAVHDDFYELDKYSDDGVINLDVTYSFDECIDEIYKALDMLID